MRGLCICLFLLFSISLFAQPGGGPAEPGTPEIDHWETLIKANEQWRYYLGTISPPATAPATNWRTLAFNDASWLQGPGGFGYGASENGDNDDVTTIPRVSAVLLRKKFTIVDLSKIVSGVLSVDYDDGFVAYLNGTEIARANMDGKGDFPSHSVFASGFGSEELVVPQSFIVSKQVLQSLLIEGENVLAVQVHDENSTSSDLTSNVYLSVGINDESSDYQPTPAWFVAPPEPLNFTSSNLPIIVINTNNQTIPNDPKIMATMGVIDNGAGNRNYLTDPFNNYNGHIGIETRGESSQDFPKKSYALETVDATGENLNVELLGFPAENDWILYAPYTDKSMMRNDITFKLSRDIGRYASRTRACEVVLNGDYQGVYILMEKIKRDDNRVDIASLNPDEISGDDLTGGYILRIDKIDGNDYPQWRIGNIDFQYFDPQGDELVTQQRGYIQSFIATVNTSIMGANWQTPTTGYVNYIDVMSFVDHMLISELGLNVDGYRYSTYMHKDKDSNGGKLIMGPLWDFNLAYGNVNYNTAVETPTAGWLYNDYRVSWFPRLMGDQNYRNKMKTRWTSLRQNKLSNARLTTLIDSLAESLAEAQVRNYQRWPILGQYVWPNQYIGNTYAEEVTWFKNWTIARANWMDANMPGSIVIEPDPVTGVDDEFVRGGLSVYPNPGTESFTFEWNNASAQLCEVTITNLMGQSVYTTRNSGREPLTWQTQSRSGATVQSGMYIVTVTSANGTRLSRKFIKK